MAQSSSLHLLALLCLLGAAYGQCLFPCLSCN